ncbi:phage tail protein [Pseudoclavibacter helvolus]|uniref:phage tail tube protein n=1 Tax=Pseudoclavibacter helvolus TaxID=255205 RepID=UPI003C75E284
MANKVTNVVSGRPDAAGGVLIGSVGVEAPTTTTSSLTAFSPAGYIHEDGVTEATELSTEKIKAWGGDTVKIVRTEHGVTYQFTFIEALNTTVLQTIYGDDNVDVTPATASTGTLHQIRITGAELKPKSYVFEIKDGDARIRIFVPHGVISELGDVTYADAEVIGYDVTIECLPDAAGVKAYKLLDDGVKTAA